MFLKGVEVRELALHPDARGFFCELYRQDWSSFFSEDVVQVNLSSTFPGVVRAWHRHARGQVDYFIVISGTVQMCAYEASSHELSCVVASDRLPCIVRIPGHYYHGVQAVGNATALLVYGTTRLYDYKDPDEERLPWNTETIVPSSINGSSFDERVGKPWDWLRPPHR